MSIRKLGIGGVEAPGLCALHSNDGTRNTRVFVHGADCKNGCCHNIAIAILGPNGMLGTKISLDDGEEIGRYIIDEVRRLRDEQAIRDGKIVVDIGS